MVFVSRRDPLERLIWSEIARFAESPGKVMGLLRRARSGGAAAGGAMDKLDRQIASKNRERERVITWARQGRIADEDLDAQLRQLRAETAALEAERRRREEARRGAESAAERLRDAEAFLDELARRVGSLAEDGRAKIVRQLVPRVIISARDGGRVKVSATYAFAPPVTIGTAPLRASP